MTRKPTGRPGGRPCLFPGKDKPATYTLPADTKQQIADLADVAGCSRSDFVTGLARRFGPQLAAELRAAADSLKDHHDHTDSGGGDSDNGDGAPDQAGDPDVAAAAAVQPARA